MDLSGVMSFSTLQVESISFSILITFLALHPLQIASPIILSETQTVQLEQSRDYLFNTSNDQIVRWDDPNMWSKFNRLLGLIE